MLDPLRKSLLCLLSALLSWVLASFSSSNPMGRQAGPQPYILPTGPLQPRESGSSPVDVAEVLVMIWLEGLRPQPWSGLGENQSVLFEWLGKWGGWASRALQMLCGKTSVKILKVRSNPPPVSSLNPFILRGRLPLHSLPPSTCTVTIPICPVTRRH